LTPETPQSCHSFGAKYTTGPTNHSDKSRVASEMKEGSDERRWAMAKREMRKNENGR
jgi:hypothetical protein